MTKKEKEIMEALSDTKIGERTKQSIVDKLMRIRNILTKDEFDKMVNAIVESIKKEERMLN